jgi:hypothetical protein
MKGVLIRLDDNDSEQTLGQLYIYDGINLVFQCKTLELPWEENKKMVSRIPEGKYKVVRRSSKKFGEHYHILNVEGRKYILMHIGNYYNQTHGCVLLGQNFVDLNKDGHLDVTVSRQTIKRMLERVGSFELTVISFDN